VRLCAVVDCDKPLSAQNTRGYCRKHRTLAPENIAAERKRQRDNREKYIAYGAKWRAANPEKARASTRQSNWKTRGVVPGTLMPEHCECCGRERPAGKRLHADHCHLTGAFRGWLCVSCNNALGLLRDMPQLAVVYLQRAYTSLTENPPNAV
jgi:Recombination endonuclease VII